MMIYRVILVCVGIVQLSGCIQTPQPQALSSTDASSAAKTAQTTTNLVAQSQTVVATSSQNFAAVTTTAQIPSPVTFTIIPNF